MELKRYLRAQWDRVAGVGLALLGAAALMLGWIGVSGTPLSSEQIPFVISGGLGGLALIGVGATIWLSADLRDEWRKLKDLEEVIERSVEAAQPAGSTAVDPPSRNGSRRKRPLTASGRSATDDG